MSVESWLGCSLSTVGSVHPLESRKEKVLKFLISVVDEDVKVGLHNLAAFWKRLRRRRAEVEVLADPVELPRCEICRVPGGDLGIEEKLSCWLVRCSTGKTWGCSGVRRRSSEATRLCKRGRDTRPLPRSGPRRCGIACECGSSVSWSTPPSKARRWV